MADFPLKIAYPRATCPINNHIAAILHLFMHPLPAQNRTISARLRPPLTPSGLAFWQGSVDAQRQRCHKSRV